MITLIIALLIMADFTPHIWQDGEARALGLARG